VRFLMESSQNDYARLLPDMRFANFPRELQASADSDLVIDYSMEVDAPNTAVDSEWRCGGMRHWPPAPPIRPAHLRPPLCRHG
jgi:hypothetical protein